MQINYDLDDLDDLSGLSESINIKELYDYSGITLRGKKLSKQQLRQLRQNVMKIGEATSNYGEIVSSNIGKQIEKKEAIYINVLDLYASPNKWNFYEPVDDNKKLELMESIEENGILSPIIVWEINKNTINEEYVNNGIDSYKFKGNKYLILAGHNRADAFNKLHDATKDDKYSKIPAFIFKDNEIDIKSAKAIVVDTNYVQRVLSTKEIVKSVMYKYAEVSDDKNKNGRVREIVAEKLGLSPTTVYNYFKLSTMIEQFQNMVYDNVVTLTSVLNIVNLKIEDQQWLYDTYGGIINTKLLNKIKSSMDRDRIEKLIEKHLEVKTSPIKQVSFEIPEHLEDKARKLIANLIEREKKKSKKVL